MGRRYCPWEESTVSLRFSTNFFSVHAQVYINNGTTIGDTEIYFTLSIVILASVGLATGESIIASKQLDVWC